MSEKSHTPDSTKSLKTTGMLLREARENLELSIQEIASRLNLQTKIIQALEADDKSGLPTITYVKGYIRSYAKIVKLDADTLIRLYEDDVQAPPEILPDVKIHTQASSSDKPVKAVTYLLIFSLILLVLAWWQSNFIVGKELLSGKLSKKSNTGFDYEYDIVIHPDTPFLEKNTTVDDNAEYLPPFEEELTSGSASTQLNTLTLPNTLAIDTTLGSAESTPVPTDERGTGPDTVSLSVKTKSWVEVYDKDKNKMYMNIAQAGAELKLNGKAPFSVILGNSRGVKVNFNGKPFDQTSYENEGVARFKLGE